MEKIIYNNKIKKIFIGVQIFIMLFNIVLPYKVLAASCTADELRTKLNNLFFDSTGVSVDNSQCTTIINKITSNGGANNGSISINDEELKVRASKETIRDAFDKTEGTGPYPSDIVTLMIENGYSYINVEILESSSKPESNSGGGSSSQEEPINDEVGSVAEDLYTLINSDPVRGYISNASITKNDCQKAIDNIENSNTLNSVNSSKNNGKINITIKATSKTIVIQAFHHMIASGAESWPEFITNGIWEEYGFYFVLIDPSSIPEGEEDTRNDQQKVYDWLVYNANQGNIDTPEQFAGTDPADWAYIIVYSGDYVYNVTWDDNGQVINVTFELDETRSKDAADGGILLEPLFALVNFVADTITSFLGEFMINEDGLESVSKESLKPADVSGLTKDDVFRVSTQSFALGTSYYKISYTPEKIFSGEVPILSVDFISGKDAEGNKIEGDWQSIRKVISDWYKVLRMIAIIGLLSVLIYTGIKIIISANAKDKAKYKEWIINWFLAVAILFSMHFIMSFIISVTNEISQLLTESNQQIIVEEVSSEADKDKADVITEEVFTTNLMGLVRYMVRSDNAKIKIGYEIMYIALLTYTIKFTFIYLKRTLNMAFLTLIAPIVALTYPIDKINDGNAQGFNMWLKEYIFNALLQPMHLILYYILVGSAVGIAASNPLYGIVVLMFMTEAEKLLKKIFGFDKASGGTVGGMAGAFAAGAVASNIKNIAKMSNLPGGNGGKDGQGLPKNDAIDSIKPVDDPSSMSAFGESPTPPAIGGSENASGGGDGSDTTGGGNGSNLTGGAGGSGNNSGGSNTTGNSASQTVTPSAQNSTQGGTSRPQSSEDILNAYENNWANAVQEGRVQMQNGRPVITPRISNDGTTPSTDPARDMAKKKETTRLQRFGKGMGAVGKSLVRPIYDFDRSGKYNAKRWGRRILRAGIGGAVGITAAAVQAGISITDGKYNPMEGMATFAAGYAGGGQITKGLGGLVDTYREGADAGDKKAQLKRAQSRYGDRDDVIAYNKKNYAGREKEVMQRQRDNWMKYGYSDPKDMKSGIKYADAWIKERYGDNFNNLSDEQKKRIWAQADERAAQTMEFRNRLKDQGQTKAIYEEDKRKKYIEEMVRQEAGANASEEDKNKIINKYQNAFRAVVEYDNAQ